MDYWYCYDTTTQLFKKIQGIDWIPSPSRLGQQENYFFTYSPNGTEIWSSDFFCVEKEQVKLIASISHVYFYEADNPNLQEKYSFYEETAKGAIEKKLAIEEFRYLSNHQYNLENSWNYLIANRLTHLSIDSKLDTLH